MTEPVDLQGCENCGKDFPIESMQMMEDNWFCEGCYVAWKQEFDACEHQWSPHTDTMGDPGRYCSKCSGFVADDAVTSPQP